jgi:hypothetical protein
MRSSPSSNKPPTSLQTRLVVRLLTRHGSHNQKAHGNRGSVSGGPPSATTTDASVGPGGIVRKDYDYAHDADLRAFDPLRPIDPQSGGDRILTHIQEKKGYNGKAEVVSKATLDKHLQEGDTELFRGVASEAFAEQLRNGPHHAGKGLYGNGTYATLDVKNAQAFAHNRLSARQGDGGATLRMALKKEARVIDYKELRDLREATTFEHKALGLALSDYGRFASVLGYDAIRLGWTNDYVILNRTALRIQQTSIARFMLSVHSAFIARHGSHNQKAHGFRGGKVGSTPTETHQTIRKDYNYADDKELAAFDPNTPGYGKDQKGDPILAHIQERRGFNGKPDVISEELLTKYIADGEIEIHRGFASEQFADDFKNGPLHASRGYGGNGTYVTTSLSTASMYAVQGGVSTGGDDGSKPSTGRRLRMTLKKDAKVISATDLHDEFMKSEFRPVYDATTKKVHIKALTDRGRFAAALGYDAIHIDWTKDPGGPDMKQHWYIVLNRTALRVQKETLPPRFEL